MSITDPYAGRTVDVVAFHGVTATGETLLDQYLADSKGGEYCTGVDKLAQKFMILLLTDQGSVQFAPGVGCNLLSDLRNGIVRSQNDVFVAFGFAAGTIGNQFSAAQLNTDPPDEVFASAVLNQIVLQPGFASLQILVTSAAGSSRAVILPVRTL